MDLILQPDLINQTPLQSKKEARRQLIKLILSCFGVSAGLMALIYFCMGIPWLGNSVLTLDLNGQYVYFFESLHDMIYNCDAGMLYTWYRSLGGEYMGIYAYYLASPFSWLVALMPSAIITESLYVMILLKIGCAGASMGWYLHKTYPTNKRNVVIFSALYALCAWSIMYGNNVMWLDTLILFPLVIYGADLILSGRNYLVYTLTLALTLLSHYYMGYMVCLFLVLYFFYFHIAHRDRADYNPKGKRAHFLGSGLRYLFFTLLAVGIAGVVIFCAAYSLTFGKDTFTDPVYQFTFKLNFLDIIFKLLPGAADTVRREGLPFIYCGTATLFGAAIFAVSPKFKTKEKVGAGLLLLILTLCFSVSLIDIWWHGGQEPNWLNYRYSFMFSFLLLVIGYRGFEQLRRVSTQFLAVVPAVLGIFLVILQQEGYGENYEYTGAVFPKAYSYDLLFYFLSPIVIGAVFLAILYFKKKGGNRLGTLALTCTILGETLFIGLLSQIALACDVSYSFRADYADFINRVEPAVEYIQDLDDGFYRMDKTFHRQPADAMALELRGVSSTTSTLNRHTLKLLDQLGFVAGSYWSQYTGGNPVTDMILGMKYIITEDTSPDALYQRVYTDEQGEAVYGYLNPYALSIGYTVNDAVLDLNFNDYDSPMVLLNDLVAAMTGKDELRPFVKLSAEDSYEDITLARSSSAKHLIYKTSEGGTAPLLTFTFTAESTDPVYLYFSTDYPRDCTLYIDGKESGTAMANDSDGIIYVGRFEEGSSHTVSLAPLEEKIYLRENQTIFWHLDEEILKESYSALQKGQYEISADYTEEHLKGTVKVDGKDTLLFTSIPYDEGWKITVDGNEVKPLTFTTPVYDEVTSEQLGVEEQPYQDALIVLRLTPGTHQIEFRYMPDCFLYGGAVSLISLFVLALITAIDYLLIRRYKKRKMATVPVSGELSASDNPAEQSANTPAEAVQEPSEAADQQTAPQDVPESEKPKKEHRKKKRK